MRSDYNTVAFRNIAARHRRPPRYFPRVRACALRSVHNHRNKRRINYRSPTHEPIHANQARLFNDIIRHNISIAFMFINHRYLCRYRSTALNRFERSSYTLSLFISLPLSDARTREIRDLASRRRGFYRPLLLATRNGGMAARCSSAPVYLPWEILFLPPPPFLTLSLSLCPTNPPDVYARGTILLDTDYSPNRFLA